jgi:transposase-like protein
MAVRWKLANSLSYRNLEELLEELEADADHSTVHKILQSGNSFIR